METLKRLVKKKRFWVTLGGLAAAGGYMAAGDVKSAVSVLGSILLGQ
jgi:ClpP class serine protease